MFSTLLIVVACRGTDSVPPVDLSGVAASPAENTDPVPNAQPLDERYAADHILITWAGAVGAASDVVRTESQAHDLASELADQARAGADFAELARSWSDDASRPRGGSLGTISPGTLVPEFEDAISQLRVGQISSPIRSPFGWHVIRRDPVDEVLISQILIATRGRAGEAIHGPDEARQRAEKALARLDAGESFEEVARDLSDEPTLAKAAITARGQLVPAVEGAAFGLEPGRHSGIVETPYGYEILLRTR